MRCSFGRGIDDETVDRFVGMYVNELTLRLRRRGATGGARAADARRGVRRSTTSPSGSSSRTDARAAVVLSAVRTPIGRYGGALSGVRPDDLAALAIAAAVERAGVDRRARSRTSTSAARTRRARTTATSRAWPSLLAGLPESVPGVTVNRLCASGLSAVVARLPRDRRGRRRPVRRRRRRVDDARAARHGEGGRSRSRAANATVYDTTLGWRFPNPRLEALFPLESMGETGENVAERWGVSREDQDAFALALAAALGGGARGGPVRRRARPGRRRRRATSIRGRTRALEKLARAEAGVPRGRHGHRRQRERHQRRRRRARDRERGEGARARRRAARRVRRQRGGGRRSARDGHRAGPGGAEAARARRRRGRRPRPRRAERGVRVAEPRRRSASSASTRRR